MAPLNDEQNKIIEQISWMLKLRDDKKDFLSRDDLSYHVRDMVERDVKKIHSDMKNILNIN